MKYISALFLLLICIYTASAQTYPFSDGFYGTPSGQVPASWTGDISVLAYHGQYEEKGLAAEISGGDLVDSIISPLIGPLTSTSTVSFYYRIIDKNIYPSTPTELEGNDRLEVKLTTDGINYQTILQIDENNHNATFNFVKKKIFVAQYAGDTVHIKFVCTFGAGAAYFVDIDSVEVKNDPMASVNDMDNDIDVRLYPNPTSGSNAKIAVANNDFYTVNIYDILGNTIHSASGSGTLPLPSSEWHSGLYMIQVKQNGKALTKKLVVQ